MAEMSDEEIDCKYLELKHIEIFCYQLAKELFDTADY
jgi:hypothetical protein